MTERQILDDAAKAIHEYLTGELDHEAFEFWYDTLFKPAVKDLERG